MYDHAGGQAALPWHRKHEPQARPSQAWAPPACGKPPGAGRTQPAVQPLPHNSFAAHPISQGREKLNQCARLVTASKDVRGKAGAAWPIQAQKKSTDVLLAAQSRRCNVHRAFPIAHDCTKYMPLRTIAEQVVHRAARSRRTRHHAAKGCRIRQASTSIPPGPACSSRWTARRHPQCLPCAHIPPPKKHTNKYKSPHKLPPQTDQMLLPPTGIWRSPTPGLFPCRAPPLNCQGQVGVRWVHPQGVSARPTSAWQSSASQLQASRNS